MGGDELAVYDLIWKRTIASQMVDARLTQDRVRLEATLRDVVGFSGEVLAGLTATGLRIEFPGFRRAYVEGTDDPEAEPVSYTHLQITRLVDRSEYKRRQMAPGVRISKKAFGRDRRMPITNAFRQETL